MQRYYTYYIVTDFKERRKMLRTHTLPYISKWKVLNTVQGSSAKRHWADQVGVQSRVQLLLLVAWRSWKPAWTKPHGHASQYVNSKGELYRVEQSALPICRYSRAPWGSNLCRSDGLREAVFFFFLFFFPSFSLLWTYLFLCGFAFTAQRNFILYFFLPLPILTLLVLVTDCRYARCSIMHREATLCMHVFFAV